MKLVNFTIDVKCDFKICGVRVFSSASDQLWNWEALLHVQHVAPLSRVWKNNAVEVNFYGCAPCLLCHIPLSSLRPSCLLLNLQEKWKGLRLIKQAQPPSILWAKPRERTRRMCLCQLCKRRQSTSPLHEYIYHPQCPGMISHITYKDGLCEGQPFPFRLTSWTDWG